MFRYLESIEPIVSFIFDIEKSIKHAQVKGFSETTRPGISEYSTIILIKNLSDKHTLVNEIFVRFTNGFKILYTYRKGFHNLR